MSPNTSLSRSRAASFIRGSDEDKNKYLKWQTVMTELAETLANIPEADRLEELSEELTLLEEYYKKDYKNKNKKLPELVRRFLKEQIVLDEEFEKDLLEQLLLREKDRRLQEHPARR